MKIVTNNHVRFIDDSYKMTQGDVIGLEEEVHRMKMAWSADVRRVSNIRHLGQLHFEMLHLGLAGEMDQVLFHSTHY